MKICVRWIYLNIIAVVLISLTACGGGGGDSAGGAGPGAGGAGPGGTGPGAGGSKSYYLYADENDGLFAVNKDNYEDRVTIELSGVPDIRTDRNPSYIDAENFNIGGVIGAYYIKNSALWHVSVEDVDAVESVKLSGNDVVCFLDKYGRDIDGNFDIVYSTPEAGQTCSSSTNRQYRAISGDAITPTNGASTFASLYDDSVFPITIIASLAVEDGVLYRYSQGYSVRESIAPVTGMVEEIANNSRYVVLNINDQLRVYDDNNKTLSDSLFDGVILEESFGTRERYFISDASLYHITLDPSPAVTLVEPNLYTLNQFDDVYIGVSTSSQYIVLSWGIYALDGSQNMAIKTIDKQTGDLVTLFESQNGRSNAIISGNHIYWTENNYSDLVHPYTTYHALADGSFIESFVDTRIAGAAFNPIISTITGFDISKILLTTGYDSASSSFSQLVSYDASSFSNPIVLGDIPDGVATISATGFSAGNVIIGRGGPSSPPFNGDLYYIDVTEAGSLQNITNTPTISEWGL